MHLNNLLRGPTPQLIRIGVRNKGCAGLSYHLDYVEKPGKFDEIVEQDGVRVLIDSKALFSIIGSEMDWEENALRYVGCPPLASTVVLIIHVMIAPSSHSGTLTSRMHVGVGNRSMLNHNDCCRESYLAHEHRPYSIISTCIHITLSSLDVEDIEPCSHVLCCLTEHTTCAGTSQLKTLGNLQAVAK